MNKVPRCSVAAKGGSGFFREGAKKLPVPPREEARRFCPALRRRAVLNLSGRGTPPDFSTTPAARVEQGTLFKKGSPIFYSSTSRILYEYTHLLMQSY